MKFLANQYMRVIWLTSSVILSLILVVGIAGCLPDARRESLEVQMSRLLSEKNQMSEQAKLLESERTRLAGDLEKMSRELADLGEHANKLRQLNAALQEDARALRAAYEVLREEHAKLLLNNPDLKGGPRDPNPGGYILKPTVKEPTNEAREVQQEENVVYGTITPCEAMIRFLQSSEAALRQYKGYERIQKLRVIRAQFFHLMENAPPEAREAADSWLTDLVRLQADPSDPSVVPFMSKRHRLLKACVKEP
jgi:hypothetical protein